MGRITRIATALIVIVFTLNAVAQVNSEDRDRMRAILNTVSIDI